MIIKNWKVYKEVNLEELDKKELIDIVKQLQEELQYPTVEEKACKEPCEDERHHWPMVYPQPWINAPYSPSYQIWDPPYQTWC